ncbi:unnamed protein product [Rotaria sp. Silwood2]|nr:unnamed protein product [Rotaria sp. Silwood2]CAF4552836.1 unnamed protein product [Rotaria sp. Silwood2]
MCDDSLSRYENNDDENHLMHHLFSGNHGTQVAELIIKFILSSMKYGSNEGDKRFSRLIQIVEFYPQTLDSIANRLQEIPCWIYETLKYSLTDPILKRNLEILRQKLDRHTPLVNEFIQALNQLNSKQQQYKITIASQDSVFGDGTGCRLLKPHLISIRYQFKNSIEKNLDTLFGNEDELFSLVLLTDVKSILTNLGTKLKSI